MPRFSANLGFLWQELPLPERVRAAAAAGFDAVECHFPYDTPAAELRQVLDETGLPLLSLNTRLGTGGTRDFGVAARPDRTDEARRHIDEAVGYAIATGCRCVNVVPGRTGRGPGTEEAFRASLAHACDAVAGAPTLILIEPINTVAAPDFHLSLVEQAIETIEAVGRDALKLLFDCHHVQIMQGRLAERLEASMPHLGHVQVSAVHDRGEPDAGEIDYPWLLARLDALGWHGHVGAEYRPRTTTDAGLGWMAAYRPAGAAIGRADDEHDGDGDGLGAAPSRAARACR